jgi:hypothetical protein
MRWGEVRGATRGIGERHGLAEEGPPRRRADRSRMWQQWRCMRPIASTRSARLRLVISSGQRSWLTERERVGLGVGLEERNLERPLPNSVVLADELVQAAVAKDAVAVLVDVDAV